ncbi:MAG: EAL domain-containing protein [Gemmatimonadaceae bacterium]|nr:EAL domain-containing protein [Gemmatimonadaceae bacterium]
MPDPQFLRRKGHELNARLRMTGTLALTVLTALAALVLEGVSWLVAAFVLAWTATRVAEYLWATSRRDREAPIPSWVVLASHIADAVAATIVVGALGGGLWIASWLYVFLIASAHASLPEAKARFATQVMVAAFLALLGGQVAGAFPSSPLFGLGAVAAAPRVAITTGLAFAVLAWTAAIIMSAIVGALRARTEQHRLVLDTATNIILVLHGDGTVRHGNRAAERAVTERGGDLVRDGLGALVLADDVPVALDAIAAAAAGPQQSLLLRAADTGAGPRWFAATITAMPHSDGAVHLLVILRDVTEERRVADAVRHSEARLRAVFDQAAVAIALTDLHGVFHEANTAIERLLGHRAEDLLGRPWTQFVPSDDHTAAHEALAGIREGAHESATFEQRFVRRDGRVVWAQLTVSRAESPDGRDGLVVMLQDVTERRALEAQLTWQAYHDPLTNLANRALFRDRVERALLAARERPGTVAVLFLDLDNFKTVNDSLGHAAGDQLLFEVARRLLSATRGCDTVARLGGDEFAILLDNIRGPADAIVVAERVLQGMQAPVLLEGREVFVGASVGIVRAEQQASADELLRDADVAMYDAKQAGKNRYAIFEPRMHSRAVARMQLEADLRVAIEAEEFTLVYQPIVRLESGRPVGLEALVRWVHPTVGPIGPDVFIPIAEETGLIVPLGRWILAEACRAAVSWNAQPALVDRIGVSVNLSPRQLEEAGLVASVRDVLRETGLPPALLTLEITETGLVGTAGAIPDRLRDLKALGVSLAIDDFGTGYSSLGYIQHFPIDVLKIDRLFVEGLKRSGGHEAALARTIVGLGHSLGLRTVAEGIEVDAQRAILSELGCALGQGYLFSRPLAGDDVLPWLARALDLPLPAFGPPGRGRTGRRTTGGMVAVA